MTVDDEAAPRTAGEGASSTGKEPGRRRHTAAYWAVGVGAVAALLLVLLATRPSGEDREAESTLIGQPAPAITGTTMTGEQFDLADLEGRWVVVNFFASWCVPCRVEHPELVAFSEAHSATGDASVLSVAFDDTPEAVAAFFEENGGDWPVVTEDLGNVVLDYGVLGVPESFLVSPDGEIVERIIGGVTREGLDQLIAEAEGS
ncbi:MAG: Thiol-disulfide oxidoreductase ResA [Acidimicrobiales bacterium]|nr:MAG: TlpA family protein disulfide reductase [Actinomycetota bacterium]MBV6510386.1 Thiol-disulfide oxidoreductase ResA [Acidimicrobiales bacterium]RIK03221.1 MAG: hypothetical protein DCC48_17055 [Acidobacteriota bacterium]